MSRNRRTFSSGSLPHVGVSPEQGARRMVVSLRNIGGRVRRTHRGLGNREAALSERSAALRRAIDRVRGRRILIIGLHYSPEQTGNAPYTAALAETLHRAGADVGVITGLPHYPAWARPDGYSGRGPWMTRINGVPVLRVDHPVPAVPSMMHRGVMEGMFALRAGMAARRNRADAVIAISPLGSIAAGLLGRRSAPLGLLVQDLIGNAAEQSGAASAGTAGRIAAVEYGLLARADLVGVITPSFGEVLTANGVAPGRIVQLPNFAHAEPSALTTHEARRRLGWPADGTVLLHTGNMGAKQGLDQLADVASLGLPAGMRIVLMGDGNQRSALERRVAGLRGIELMPPVASELYPVALRAADVLVLTERAGVREMSLPSKLTSYSTSGKPILAAVDPSGITHALLEQHRAAVMTPAGDAPAFLDAARQLRDDGALRAEIATSARAMHDALYTRAAAEERYLAFAARLVDPSFWAGS